MCRKITEIVATRCQILRDEMHQIQFWLGAPPQTPLTALPRPPSWIYGVSYLMSVLLSFVVKLLNIRGTMPLRHLSHMPS